MRNNTPSRSSLLSRAGGLVSGLAGRVIASALKTYDSNWFVRFMKLSYDEDVESGTVLTDVMRQQPWVNIAVTIRASNFARAPFRISRGKTEVTSGSIFDLFSRVNASLSRYQLWEATESWMSVRGEAIWVFERDFGGATQAVANRALPKEIWVPDPRRFTHRLNPEGSAVAMWVAEGVSGGRHERIPYLPDQVIHFRDWNPWDEWRGVCPVIALSEEAIADWQAARSMRRLFENDSTPGGVLSSEQPLRPDQAQDIQEQWEMQHRGMSRRHRLAVLGFGTKYQPVQRTPDELKYIDMRRFNRSMVLARMGIPPGVAGLKDEATPLSGKDLQEQMRQLWTVTLVPRTVRYQDKLKVDFFDRFNLEEEGRFDLSEIEELKPDAVAVRDGELREIAAGALTINEYRARRHLPPVSWGHSWWIPFALAPAGDGNGKAIEELPEEERNVTPQRQLIPVVPLAALSLTEVRRLAEGTSAPVNGKRIPLAEKAEEAKNVPLVAENLPNTPRVPLVQAEQLTEIVPGIPTQADPAAKASWWSVTYRERHWKAAIAKQDRVEDHYRKALQAWLFAQRSRILEVLSRSAIPAVAKGFDLATFDAQFGADYWRAQLGELKEISHEDFLKMLPAVEEDVKDLLKDAGLVSRADAFDIYDTEALQYLKQRVNKGKLGEIVDTLRGQLRDVIREGFEGGATVDDIAADIRRVYDIGKARSQTIARTELGGIVGDSRFASFQAEGFEQTEWLSAVDERVRTGTDEHPNWRHDIDGEKAKIGEPFSNDLLYPNDPNGEAGNVINCLLPGTRVQGAIVAGLKAWYSGPAVEIVTVRGNRLSVTPNHPILTADGRWKRAADIAEGDALICYGSEVEVFTALRPMDDQDKPPALVEEAFEALRSCGSTMVVEAYLHGDGIFVKGKIEIVGPARDLLLNSMAIASDGIGDGVFKMSMDTLSRHGATLQGSRRGDSASGRSSGTCTLTLDKSAVDLHARPFHEFGFRPRANRDSAFPKTCGKQASADIGFIGETLHADAGEIAFDEHSQMAFGKSGSFALSFGPAAHLDATASESAKENGGWDTGFLDQLRQSDAGAMVNDEVVEVRNLTFTGHVYDLQSVGGWIVAEKIVSGNCRCLGLPVIEEKR